MMKDLLSTNGLIFVEIDLEEYPERLKDLKLLSVSNKVKTPQLFCNNQHVASSVSQLRGIFCSWEREYGSITSGCKASLRKYPCWHDVRLRLPCHLGCTSVANRSLSMITVPNPLRRISLVQVTRYLMKHLPNETIEIKKREYRRSFFGKTLLEVLEEWLRLTSEQAKAFGWQILDYGLVMPLEKNVKTIKCDSIYRLRALDRPNILNWSFPFLGNALDTTLLSPNQVLLQLCRILEKVFEKYNSDVQGMLQSIEFEYFEEAVSTLQNICLPIGDSIYLINLFNLIVRHALIVCNRMGSCWNKLLDQIFYQFQDTTIRLNEIKAKLLNNNKGKKSFFPNFVCFSPVENFDPRHQLLCSNGTNACPTIRIYRNETDIDNAVRDFLQQEIQFQGNELRLPRILLTFFSSKQDLMEWLIKFLDGYQLQLVAKYHNKLVIKYSNNNELARIIDLNKRTISGGSVTISATNRCASFIPKMAKRSTLQTASISNMEGDIIEQNDSVTRKWIEICQ